MWPKAYRDYKVDSVQVKHQVEPGKGIIGCEMHDLNGWGETYHVYQRRKGFFSKLWKRFFRSTKEPTA